MKLDEDILKAKTKLDFKKNPRKDMLCVPFDEEDVKLCEKITSSAFSVLFLVEEFM